MRHALILVAFVIALHASGAEPRLGRISDLREPTAAEAQQVEYIRKAALRFWFQRAGLLAEESLRVAGSFTLVRPISRFADRGDKIWEVRVVHLTQRPTGILWMNDRTEQIIALGPEK